MLRLVKSNHQIPSDFGRGLVKSIFFEKSRWISNADFQKVHGHTWNAPASLSRASSSLTHTRRMDGFCNQNADQLGSLAGLSFPIVYVGVVEYAPL
jgi:hypothetical protein